MARRPLPTSARELERATTVAQPRHGAGRFYRRRRRVVPYRATSPTTRPSNAGDRFSKIPKATGAIANEPSSPWPGNWPWTSGNGRPAKPPRRTRLGNEFGRLKRGAQAEHLKHVPDS